MLRSLVRAALARLRGEDAVLSTGLAVAACLPEPVLGGSRRHGCSPPSWEKVGPGPALVPGFQVRMDAPSA